jgi:hypothetical protein
MRQLTKQEEHSLYNLVLLQGIDLGFGKLSLCDLARRRHSQIKTDRRWQVHCDDARYPWSKVYDDIGPAITKFMEIKSHISGGTHVQPSTSNADS